MGSTARTGHRPDLQPLAPQRHGVFWFADTFEGEDTTTLVWELLSRQGRDGAR